MRCKIVPGTALAFEIFEKWCSRVGLRLEKPADGWVLIAAETPKGLVLVSGAALRIRGDHVLLDSFVGHPDLLDREAHGLALATIGTAGGFATALGKQLRAPAPTPGVRRVLERCGFRPAGPALPGMMFVEPGVGPFEAPRARATRKPKPAEPPKRRIPAAAASRKRR